MIQYEAAVIQEHARRLYSRATAIVVVYALFAFLVGAGAGLALVEESGLAFAGALLCSLLGVAAGTTRSFQLRLEAQLALCQMQIEQHTRYLATMQSQAGVQVGVQHHQPPSPQRPGR